MRIGVAGVAHAAIAAFCLFADRARAQADAASNVPAVDSASAAASSPEHRLPGDPTPEPTDQMRLVTPNRKLLMVSSVVFGAAYLPSTILAIVGTNDADRYLFIPIAGPFIDLLVRDCTGPAAVRCSNATLNGVGLFFDGFFQVTGALGVLLSFKIPEWQWMPPARPAAFPSGGFGVVVTLYAEDQRGLLQR